MKKNKRKVNKIGLPPGSVVYTGNKDIKESIIIESINFNEHSFKRGLQVT